MPKRREGTYQPQEQVFAPTETGEVYEAGAERQEEESVAQQGREDKLESLTLSLDEALATIEDLKAERDELEKLIEQNPDMADSLQSSIETNKIEMKRAERQKRNSERLKSIAELDNEYDITSEEKDRLMEIAQNIPEDLIYRGMPDLSNDSDDVVRLLRTESGKDLIRSGVLERISDIKDNQDDGFSALQQVARLIQESSMREFGRDAQVIDALKEALLEKVPDNMPDRSPNDINDYGLRIMNVAKNMGIENFDPVVIKFPDLNSQMRY